MKLGFSGNGIIIKTPDKRLNILIDTWTRHLSNNIDFDLGLSQNTGFRKLNQLILGLVTFTPQIVRQRILELAEMLNNSIDLNCKNHFEPGKNYNEMGIDLPEDPMWLILSTAAYIKETGDFDILGEMTDSKTGNKTAGNLSELLKNYFNNSLVNLNLYILPLYTRYYFDKTDYIFSIYRKYSQLERSKEEKMTEWLMAVQFYIFISPEYAKLCEYAGDADEARYAQRHLKALRNHVLEMSDGNEKFLYNFDDCADLIPLVYEQLVMDWNTMLMRRMNNEGFYTEAAWNFMIVSQWILGVKAGYEGLVVDPCIPPGWDNFRIERNFRGARYNIKVKNPAHISKGVQYLKVDGVEFIGNVIPMYNDAGNHNVDVIMGDG